MQRLRITTWNCNGAFRKKWQAAAELDADLLIVQECEDPRQTTDSAYQRWASNHLWCGANKSKGVGVFARRDLVLTRVSLHAQSLQLFLPVHVLDMRDQREWPLLATWTKHADSPNFRYIGQLWKFLQIHRDFLRHPCGMAIGDFNSNTQWDEWDRWWNHSDVVRDLNGCGLESVYHRHFGEEQGQETQPTFYLHRKLEKPYHIDYGFVGTAWSVQNVQLGKPDIWLGLSDHIPLTIDLEAAEL